MTEKTALTPASAAPPAVPLSPGIRKGNVVQVAGQIPSDPATGENPRVGDVAGQTRLTLQNVEAVLTAGGATFEDVVMMRVYITTPDNFGPMNEAYAEYLRDKLPSGVFPARTTLIVGLAREDLLVEIDALAVLD
jgi:2-iminobutanoate/2-iminopropanoate deaminase